MTVPSIISRDCSIKRKLLAPLFAAGIGACAIAIAWFHAESSSRELQAAFVKGEALANVLRHAGAAVRSRDELARLVQAVGGRRDGTRIVILSGRPLRVLISTEAGWIGCPLATVLPGETVALIGAASGSDRVLRSTDASQSPAVAARIPILLSESTPAEPAATPAVVLVQLDVGTTAPAFAIRDFTVTLLVGFGLFALAGYALVERLVLEPIARIRRAVCQGREATLQAWSAATTKDELGDLATALREALERRDSARRELQNLKYALDQHTLVVVTDLQGIITDVNDRFCGISGYQREELVGQHHRLLRSGKHPDEFYAELWATVRSGAVWQGEICNRAKNGELYWDEGSIVPLIGSDGHPSSFISIRTSITARKHSEAALSQERFLMQALMSTLPDHVYFKDRSSRFIRISQSKARSHGLADPAEAIGKTDFDYFGLEHAQNAYADEQKILQTGGTLIHEERETWSDRPDRWVATTKIPLRDAAGSVVGTFGISRDITAQKAAEAALHAAKEAAESANRAKSDFLATMSHEIRTPMNVVLGFTDLLIETPLQAKQREFVELIRTSGRNLVALINDILDFSKIEAGKLQVEMGRVDGLAVANEVVRTFSSQAQRKGLWLAVRRVPEAPRVLVGDTLRLRQVLTNLVGNALKFTTTGGVTVTLSRSEGANSPRIRLTVTDTGIGISPDKLGLLFHKFSQADSSTTREFGGTGLGLAISKRLVELMGGEIGVTSEPGLGASFWCELPLSPDQGNPVVPSAPFATPDTRSPERLVVPAPSLRKRRVLVVDDNELNQQLAASFLQKLGCESVLAGNGQEAVGFVQWQEFDLIIMDHQMPVMDGCEAARAIREWERVQNRPNRIPILAVTANAAPHSQEFYRAAGMDGYLAKPITRRLLAQAMNAILDPDQPAASANPPTPVPLPAPSPVTPSAALFDRERALQQLDQNHVLLALLVEAFSAQSHELLSGIERAVRDCNAPDLRQQAHKLKGSVATFAADHVWTAAKALEAAANHPDWPEIATASEHLIADVRRLRTELAAFAATVPAGSPST